MSHGSTHSRNLQLVSRVADAFRLRERTLTQIDPHGLRYVANILVWMHWAFGIQGLAQAFYRPIDGYWAPQYVAYLLFIALLMAFNGYLHYLVLSRRVITGRWVLASCALDVAVLSLAVAIDNGFNSYHFHLLYYPPLAFLAVVITSFRITMALTTMVVAIYLGLSLAAGDGLDLEARDEKVLLARIFVMYLVVVLVNLISRFERARWRQAVEREQALLRERTELSRAIHNTTAQSAYMIGLGIDTARKLAGDSNPELTASLEATSDLSRSTIWDLRHPIGLGGIYEGRELGRALRSHATSFTNVTSVPAEMTQTGVEPALSIEATGLLFSIAHNALTNAFRHAEAGGVSIELETSEEGIRLSVSDDGIGLPVDYAERGHGFSNMSRDAERLGGRLVVERRGRLGGVTVTCLVPLAERDRKENGDAVRQTDQSDDR